MFCNQNFMMDALEKNDFKWPIWKAYAKDGQNITPVFTTFIVELPAFVFSFGFRSYLNKEICNNFKGLEKCSKTAAHPFLFAMWKQRRYIHPFVSFFPKVNW